jgi:hypothetical protein
MNIKDFLFFNIVLFGTSCFLHGQSTSFDIGVEGGPCLTQLHASIGSYKNSTFSIGGMSGGFFQYPVRRLLEERCVSVMQNLASRLFYVSLYQYYEKHGKTENLY